MKNSSHSESSHIPQSSGACASARENRPEWVQRTIVMPHACITRRPSKHTTTDIFNTLRTACFLYKKYAKNGVAQRFRHSQGDFCLGGQNYKGASPHEGWNTPFSSAKDELFLDDFPVTAFVLSDTNDQALVLQHRDSRINCIATDLKYSRSMGGIYILILANHSEDPLLSY